MPPKRSKSAAAKRVLRKELIETGDEWCMHCFRSAIKATKTELAQKGRLLMTDRLAINCGFHSASTTRCKQCNERGDTCDP